MRNIRHYWLALGSAFVLHAAVASAQPAPLPDYHTKGFSLGLHLNATSWKLEQGDLDIDQTDGGEAWDSCSDMASATW